jgi:hypothetical protein
LKEHIPRIADFQIKLEDQENKIIKIADYIQKDNLALHK